MEQPKISIIMPVYNSESYMKKSIESVLNQTTPSLELICVNDKSTDHSLDILKEIQKKDSRLKIINNVKNCGPGQSRNNALKKAKGDFIMFVDSDDWLELGACNKLYETAKSEKADIVYIRPKLVFNTKIILDKRLLQKGELDNKEKIFRKNLRRKIAWAPWSKMIKRDLIIKNKVLFPEIHIAEDIVFSTEILYYANKITECKEYLYNYLIREGSLMSYKNPERRIVNYFESIKILDKFLKSKKIEDKYRKDFIYFKYYTYLAIYGVLYYSGKEVNSNKYKKLIKTDEDFKLKKILDLRTRDSVVLGSILIKLNLFELVFFFRERIRSLLQISRK